MSRIPTIDPTTAEPAAKVILDQVQETMGGVPNLISSMAQSPAVAQAYLGFNQALSGGKLDPKLRERLALTVGESNDCHYCVSAHTVLGSKVGLSEAEIERARRGDSECETARAALQFAQKVVENRGRVQNDEVEKLQEQGFDHGQIAEIVGHVALNTFTNYFNHVAGTEVDFPLAKPLASA